MTTVAAALTAARGKLPAGEARLLLGHVLQRPAAWLLAHDDFPLGEDAMLAFASLVARRAGGEPVAYLVGYREFFGRRFAVTPATLIPRPETELLVDLAIGKVGAGSTASILDLGTGSGCIAISLALELPAARLTGVDFSALALEVARANTLALAADVCLRQSDWFAALDGERYDVIVGNPPYVAAADPHLGRGDLRHEPLTALASGGDGLDAIRRIVATAPRFLKPGGALLLEHGHDQGPTVRELMMAAGFGKLAQHRDLGGIPRVTSGIFGDETSGCTSADRIDAEEQVRQRKEKQ
ncbi:MAG: peptide chain release factor N(5)-glutamine methyltransferase [Rhodocyclales bacterium]|nr:peptide chain release factor N(5)-glutamine methyltransferase [Rhodocyclales bacterium]